MKVSILKSKIHTGRAINRDIDSLSVLKTKKDKQDAPLWSFNHTQNRLDGPITVSGIIIDYDDYKPPSIVATFWYLVHKTHTGKHRIIVPFDREYSAPTEKKYKEEYLHILSLLFGPSYNELFSKTNKDEGTILQYSCCGLKRWFFMRPYKEELQSFNEIPYKPSFRIKNDEEAKTSAQLKCHPISYEDKLPFVRLQMLHRVYHFYEYYQELIDWSILDTNGYCVFDWHPKTICGSLFNYPTTIPAHINCKHDSCYSKLILYINEMIYKHYKDDDPNIIKIKSPTVLYIAAAILKGIWAIEWVEMTVFKRYPSLYDSVDRLQFLKFKSKIDAPKWLKIYHLNCVVNPDNLAIYDYVDDKYVIKSEKNIMLEYQYTLGTYFAYRTQTIKKTRNHHTYIESLVKDVKACMLDNFSTVRKVEHLNLINGIIVFDIGKGIYEFQPHDRHIFSTVKVNYEYDKNADCPLWKRTLSDYFEDINSRQIKLLQEYFGYCLTYDRTLEKMLFLFGASRGGKGTIAHVLQHLIYGGDSGSSDVVSMTNLLDQDKRSTLLRDKKVIFIDELPNLKNKDVINDLKKISSTNGIEMRLLFEQVYMSYEVPKILIAFNKLPSHFEIDVALKNRMLSIKFVNSFIGRENTNLKTQLIAEMPGILNWALEGYTRLYERRQFTSYNTDTNILYRTANEESFSLLDFLEEKLKDKYLWKPTELLDDYQTKMGDFTISSRKLAHMLSDVGVKNTMRSGYKYYDLRGI